jgi:hypothetical protein
MKGQPRGRAHASMKAAAPAYESTARRSVTQVSAFARRRGAEQRSKNSTDANMGLPSSLCSARRSSSTARGATRHSPQVQGCGGDAAVKKSSVERPGAGEAERRGLGPVRWRSPGLQQLRLSRRGLWLPRRRLPCAAAPAPWCSGDGGTPSDGLVFKIARRCGAPTAQATSSPTGPASPTDGLLLRAPLPSSSPFSPPLISGGGGGFGEIPKAAARYREAGVEGIYRAAP